MRLTVQAQPGKPDGGSHVSVFGRLSDALDRGHSSKQPGDSPPKDAAGSQFADFRTRLSSRFRTASAEAPPADGQA